MTDRLHRVDQQWPSLTDSLGIKLNGFTLWHIQEIRPAPERAFLFCLLIWIQHPEGCDLDGVVILRILSILLSFRDKTAANCFRDILVTSILDFTFHSREIHDIDLHTIICLQATHLLSRESHYFIFNRDINTEHRW